MSDLGSFRLGEEKKKKVTSLEVDSRSMTAILPRQDVDVKRCSCNVPHQVHFYHVFKVSIA